MDASGDGAINLADAWPNKVYGLFLGLIEFLWNYMSVG